MLGTLLISKTTRSGAVASVVLCRASCKSKVSQAQTGDFLLAKRGYVCTEVQGAEKRNATAGSEPIARPGRREVERWMSRSSLMGKQAQETSSTALCYMQRTANSQWREIIWTFWWPRGRREQETLAGGSRVRTQKRVTGASEGYPENRSKKRRCWSEREL